MPAQQVSYAVLTAAMRVHTELGQGLLESAYIACLQYELNDVGFRSAAQVGLPVIYRGVKLELGYRMDLLVEDLVVVEIKSVDAISPVHQAQILSYVWLHGVKGGRMVHVGAVDAR